MIRRGTNVDGSIRRGATRRAPLVAPTRSEPVPRLRRRHLDALRSITNAEALRVTVRGDCMEPILRDGDHVSVVAARPRPGDVIVFADRLGQLVVHRYLGRRAGRRGQFRSRGDRCERPDPARSLGALIGVVEDLHVRVAAADRALAVMRWVEAELREVLSQARRWVRAATGEART